LPVALLVVLLEPQGQLRLNTHYEGREVREAEREDWIFLPSTTGTDIFMEQMLELARVAVHV
jgi:hypothetical protein